MGPGTHIIERLSKRIQPLNRQDAASMVHDIEYMNPYISEKQADQTALLNAGSSLNPFKLIMKGGFALKDFFGGYNPEKDYSKYLIAKGLLNQNYQDVIQRYDLKFSPLPKSHPF